MARQTFDTVDLLRLEIEGLSPLRNMIRNPDGEDGPWAWRYKGSAMIGGQPVYSTSLDGITMRATSTLGPIGDRQNLATERIAIPGGTPPGDTRKFRAFYTLASSLSGSGLVGRIAYEYYGDSGPLGSIPPTGDRTTPGLLSGPAVTLPTGTTSVAVRVNLTRTSGVNSLFDALTFTDAVAVIGTPAEIADYTPTAFPAWQSILGSAISLNLTRPELDVGVLSGVIRDTALDPATSQSLRRGRRVRLRTLVGGVWERLGWDGIDQVMAHMHGFETRSFDSAEAQQLNKEIFECIYFSGLKTSCELAAKDGAPCRPCCQPAV